VFFVLTAKIERGDIRINMSWQRILESARKNGFPVIVTDIAGREPMVVMPFDTFEEMNEVYQSSLDSWEEERGEEFEYSDIESGSDETIESSIPAYGAEATQEGSVSEEPSKSSMREKPEGNMNEVSHLSMEERFYLEPVDDQS